MAGDIGEADAHAATMQAELTAIHNFTTAFSYIGAGACNLFRYNVLMDRTYDSGFGLPVHPPTSYISGGRRSAQSGYAPIEFSGES
jgi:hypothetical protein